MTGKRRSRRGGTTEYKGVYWYLLEDGKTKRWRCMWVSSDGAKEWKTGLRSEDAAVKYRARMMTQAEDGLRRTTTDPFEVLYDKWLRSKRGITEGTRGGYEDAGEIRLKPAFKGVALRKLDYEVIDDQVTEWDECGDWAPKTINNTLGALSSFLTDMVKARKIAQNPAQFVERLDEEQIERDWLRPHEIPVYLDACSELYRPVADFLIETGARISEALAVKLPDLEFLGDGIVQIKRTRRDAAERDRGRRARRGRDAREGDTKGKLFRVVAVGPEFATRLEARAAIVSEFSPDRDAYLFTMPARDPAYELRSKGARSGASGRWGGGGAIDRNTVSRNWHKDTLTDAGLRDMPLHALRHTAAALWLRDHDLEFVRRQLGHAQITTTQRIYGHLEQAFMVQRAAASERRRMAGQDREGDRGLA